MTHPDLLANGPAPRARRNTIAQRTLAVTALALAVTALGAACSGTPTRSVTHEMTLQQAALVPPPSGLTTIGPLPGAGRFSVEGTYATGVGDETASGDGGHVTLNHVIEARVAAGASDFIEVGLGAEWASATWGTRRSSFIDLAPSTSTSYWRLMPGVRGVLARSELFEMGAGFDIGFGRLPLRRELHYEVTVVDYENGEPTTSTQIINRDRSQNAIAYYPYARLSFFGTVAPSGPLFGTLGLQLQNEPVFTNRAVQRVTCTEYDGIYFDPEVACPELGDFGEFTVLHSAFVATMALGVGGTIGPLTLTGQVHAHLSGDEAISRVTPVGADIAARLTF
jgi:hypothetical protein